LNFKEKKSERVQKLLYTRRAGGAKGNKNTTVGSIAGGRYDKKRGEKTVTILLWDDKRKS